jgi:peroxiredoxin Q/BCP
MARRVAEGAVILLAVDIGAKGASMVEVGQSAPDFELPDQNGDPVSLSGFRGQRVVVYFYPKAVAPGI